MNRLLKRPYTPDDVLQHIDAEGQLTGTILVQLDELMTDKAVSSRMLLRRLVDGVALSGFYMEVVGSLPGNVLCIRLTGEVDPAYLAARHGYTSLFGD